MKRIFTILSFLMVIMLSAWCFGSDKGSQPSSTSAAKPAHEILHVPVWTAPFGGINYIIANAMSEIAKKSHPWLRFDVMETPGYIYNLNELEKHPEQWDKVVIGSGICTVALAEKGDPLFAKKVLGMRAIGGGALVPHGIVTFNPNIKTIADLAGKKLGIGRKAQIGAGMLHTYVLKYGWGILDKIKVEFVGYTGAKEALLDGLVDACGIEVFVVPGTANECYPSSALIELIATGRPLYAIDYGKEQIEKTNAALGLNLAAIKIPAGSVKGLNREFHLFADTWDEWVKDVFPEEIAYEITKLHLDHYPELVGYHAQGKAIIPKSWLIGKTKRNTHPGAIRAYNEYGYTIPD